MVDQVDSGSVKFIFGGCGCAIFENVLLAEKIKVKSLNRELITIKTKIEYNVFQIVDRRSQYGICYMRVSTKEQNERRQFIALQEYGIGNNRIYIDKQSGKDFERTQYQLLMRTLKCGDTLVIKSIDRLGRNYEEILEQWRIITKEKRIDIVVIDMPLLDTRKNRDLTGTLIADIVLQLLSYVAQTEREFIRQRQAEGIAAAKQQGVKFGRKPMERPLEYSKLKEQWRQGEISARSAAKQLGITHRTFLLWVNENRDG